MKKWIVWGIGIVIGSIGGFMYWYYVGCISGTCAITSSLTNSTLYGGLMGGLVVNIFTTTKKENTSNENRGNEESR